MFNRPLYLTHVGLECIAPGAPYPQEDALPYDFNWSDETGAPADSAITLTVGDEKLDAKLPQTGSYATFRKFELGTVSIASAGIVTIKASSTAEGWAAINLATVTLTPKK